MYKTKPVSELIFFVVMIFICLAVSLFLIKLLSCDDSRYNPKTQLLQYEGQIVDYTEIKGVLYFRVVGLPDAEFKTNLRSLISKEDFEKSIRGNEVFKITFSDNTLHKNQYEIITLSSEKTVMVSQDSRGKAVTISLIIYGLGLVLVCTGLIYFFLAIVRWFR